MERYSSFDGLGNEVRCDQAQRFHCCFAVPFPRRPIVFSLSLLAVEEVFATHVLKPFNVEELPTHGGSLRILACRTASANHATGPGMASAGRRKGRRLRSGGNISDVPGPCRVNQGRPLSFLQKAKRNGESVAADGAAAKSVGGQAGIVFMA